MAQRSWLQAHDSPQANMASPQTATTTGRHWGYNLLPGSLPAQTISGDVLISGPSTYAAPSPLAISPTSDKQPQRLTSVEISRKVKACAACRKQKIRCHMENGKPPCTRCKQRNLSCVLNKSLQMLMEERSQWHQDVVKDLEFLHSALQETRQHTTLDLLPPLRSSGARRDSDPMDPGGQSVEDRFSDDKNSPGMTTLFEDNMPPAATLGGGSREHAGSPSYTYSFTNIQPRRPSFGSAVVTRDFISAGQISVADAQKLSELFTNVLDKFVDGVGGRWGTLDELRCRSPILTASVLAVAALHDPHSDSIYTICTQEFRRLMVAKLFDLRVDRDYLRALCLASYWLSDAGWTLSGVAIRKATEVNLPGSYHRAIDEGSEDAADCLRLWYHLCLCDRALCFVLGRESLMHDDRSIVGWGEFLKSPVARRQDKILIMMLGAHLVLGPIREVFGPNINVPVPTAGAAHITYYSQQLDHWLGVWLSVLREDMAATGLIPGVGELHQKGAMMHYHFAKLYLCSHAYRGLSPTAPMPEALRDAARSATASAMDVLRLCLNDPDVGGGLRGIPVAFYAMLAYTCVFILKVAVNRPDGLVELDTVSGLIARLVQRLRGLQVSKWHPAFSVADILEKTAASYLSPERIDSSGSVSRNDSVVSADGSGNMIEEAAQRASNLFPDSHPSTSVMHQSNLQADERTGGDRSHGVSGLFSPQEGPVLAFGPSNLFDFGAASRSAQDDGHGAGHQ